MGLLGFESRRIVHEALQHIRSDAHLRETGGKRDEALNARAHQHRRHSDLRLRQRGREVSHPGQRLLDQAAADVLVESGLGRVNRHVDAIKVCESRETGRDSRRDQRAVGGECCMDALAIELPQVVEAPGIQQRLAVAADIRLARLFRKRHDRAPHFIGDGPRLGAGRRPARRQRTHLARQVAAAGDFNQHACRRTESGGHWAHFDTIQQFSGTAE